MKRNETPLTVLYGYPDEEDKVVFLGRQNEIVLGLDQEVRSVFLRFIRLCNGLRKTSEIQKLLSDVPEDLFSQLMSVCEEHGIICDSRKLFLNFHEDSSNPLLFAQSITPDEARNLIHYREPVVSGVSSISIEQCNDSMILEILKNRKSVDTFGKAPVPMDALAGLLASMYSSGEHRPVPSAGGLYPLSLYIARKTERDSRMLYVYNPESSELRSLGIRVTDDELSNTLDSYKAKDCDLVIFIVADLERMSKKYANRGYRYALIETGHVAQNAYLFCAENDLGIREYCGFQDDLTAKLLGLRYPDQAVLSVLLIGEIDTRNIPEADQQVIANNLRQELVGESKPIDWINVRQLKFEERRFPKAVAVAKFKSVDENGVFKSNPDNIAFGISPTSDEASIKAMAEGYERHASGLARADVIARAVDLDAKFFDPRITTPFSEKQIKHLRLQTFDPSTVREWVSGHRWSTGDTVYVPIDHAFYPLHSNTLCYRASSSGVAAHFDFNEAVNRALYELIERDALSLTWYSRRSVPKIPVNFIGKQVEETANFWGSKGWEMSLLDLTIDSIPVILAIFHSKMQYPRFVSGASANPSLEIAAMKATEEAEIMLLLALGGTEQKAGSPTQTQSPIDHGRLYFHDENFERVRWLTEQSEFVSRRFTPEDPFKKFDPIILNLTPIGAENGLKVVRVLSEHLLPINFGYWTEHFGHPRFNVLELLWKQDHPSFPHFFA